MRGNRFSNRFRSYSVVPFAGRTFESTCTVTHCRTHCKTEKPFCVGCTAPRTRSTDARIARAFRTNARANVTFPHARDGPEGHEKENLVRVGNTVHVSVDVVRRGARVRVGGGAIWSEYGRSVRTWVHARVRTRGRRACHGSASSTTRCTRRGDMGTEAEWFRGTPHEIVSRTPYVPSLPGTHHVGVQTSRSSPSSQQQTITSLTLMCGTSRSVDGSIEAPDT